MGFFVCFFKNNYAYPHGETFFVHQLFLTQPLRQTGEHQCPTLICQHVRGLLSPRQHKLPLSLYTWALTLCLSDVRQIRPRARRAAADLCANQLITATGTIALHYATLRVCVCVCAALIIMMFIYCGQLFKKRFNCVMRSHISACEFKFFKIWNKFERMVFLKAAPVVAL